MNSDKDRRHRNRHLLPRLLHVYLAVVLWVVAMVLRLVQLQVFQVDDYRDLAQQQREGFDVLEPRRGDILDLQLGNLAINVEMDVLTADPTAVQSPLDLAQQLAPILEVSEAQIYRKLMQKSRFVYLARRLHPTQSQQIRRLKQPGVFLRKESQRFYPGGQLAAHVLGFVNREHQGLSGLEYLYDERIRGEPSRVHLTLDARRNSYRRTESRDGREGEFLVLNLDRSLQFIAEDVLAKAIESAQATNGSLIAMEPSSGEIRALASYPTFNPNRYSDFDAEQRRNRAILEIFEPGSVFKVVTMAALLEEGLTDLEEVIDCTVGSLRLGNKVYREAKKSFGELTVAEILAKSSNVGTIKLALRLGPERLHSYIRLFGFGAESGVDLPGEQVGLLRPVSEWSTVSIGSISIGQEIGVTPLQMLRALAVVANGGYLVKPAVVRQVLTPEGDLVERTNPVRRRILTENTTRLMKQAMAQVVEEGTAALAALDGYSSGGKTGTAQKFVGQSYSKSLYVASYMGFAPLNEPALAAIVIVNEPKNEYYGGRVAAPVFKEFMDRALIQLKVPRDQPRKNPLLLAREAKPTREPGADFSFQTDENELTSDEDWRADVISLTEKEPKFATARRQVVSGRLATVPDFSGMSLRRVASECGRLGLVLKVAGSGRVVGQRPSAGTPVRAGSVCEVFFSN